ncbi:unnamed protein product [Nippostrongylus brasiliensis]|uniref:C2H2-type domain-containing protein n=1 Tax=Nippostrongylus brasiliensis TaxID=27835 RepID=A0A0N4Y200_NIPBR|nr:unnamed protein product [Nippostrongylus brasiliensis]
MERAITAYNCPEYGEPKGKHVYRHLLSVHAWTPERVETLKVERRNRKASREDHESLVEHVSLHHTNSPEDYKIEMEIFKDKKDFEVGITQFVDS